jgi:hypothetical protein
MTPTYEQYRAAGRDHETAEKFVRIDAIVTARAQAVESLGDEERESLADAYTEFNEAIDADPEILAARKRAAEQHRRGERVRFDITKRAEEIRRYVFAAHASPRTTKTHAAGTASTANGNGTVVRRAESSGTPRASSSRSRSRSPSSSDDDPSEPAERRCSNCGDLFLTHDGRRHYCSDCSEEAKDPAFRQRVKRNPLTDDEPNAEELDRLVGTTTWEFSCKHDDDHEVPHGWAPDGVCFKCGRVRGAVTRGWLGDGRSEHGSVVNAPAPKRKSPRLGDGSRKLVFTDEHGERRRLTDKGVIAA